MLCAVLFHNSKGNLRQQNLKQETSFGLKLKYYTYMVYYYIPFIRFKGRGFRLDKSPTIGTAQKSKTNLQYWRSVNYLACLGLACIRAGTDRCSAGCYTHCQQWKNTYIFYLNTY